MTVENVDRFEKALEGFPRLAGEEVENQVKYAAQKIITALQLYPPVPYGSTYQRTFDLRDGWLNPSEFQTNYVGGFDFDFHIQNNTPYAGFVQGGKDDDPKQTAVHRAHGWQTTDTVAEQFDGELGKEAEKQLQMSLMESFFGW
jgi:hypothetical protein